MNNGAIYKFYMFFNRFSAQNRYSSPLFWQYSIFMKSYMFKKNVIKFIESQFFKIKTGKMLFRSLVLSLEGLGKSFIMTSETIACIFKGDISVKSTVSQMIEVGWRLLS